jgi:hypothetical protein|nr:MAG TPA: Protein of unknown function (DUF2552) [Caudoviricetes sp.]
MKQIILIILMMICGITIAGIVLYWLSLLHWSIAVIVGAIVAAGILGGYIK